MDRQRSARAGLVLVDCFRPSIAAASAFIRRVFSLHAR
jgi:hypothetical protein